MKGSFEENINQLELWNSFAFIHEGSEYYFARKLEEDHKNTCGYFVGFKNNHLKYSFPVTVFNDLNKIYEEKKTVNERILIALSKFDEYQKTSIPEDCVSTTKTSASEVMDTMLTLIVYSPALIVVSPIIAADMANRWLYDADKIRLGMSFKKVQSLLGNQSFAKRKVMGQTFYVYDRDRNRLVMYFENNRIKAWVRGEKPWE